MPRQKLNNFDAAHNSVRIYHADIKNNKTYHFLYVPILISILAVFLILSPAMANESQLKISDCPYVQQYHQVIKLDLLKNERKSNLISVSAGNTDLEIKQSSIRTISF